MPDSSRLQLRRSLVDGYNQLRRRLAQRLGSTTLASEALNETWLALGKGGDLGKVADADAYVYRAALHAAGALLKREARHAAHADLAEIRDLPDDAPPADRIVASRHEAERRKEALSELPQGQRDALLDALADDVPLDDRVIISGDEVERMMAALRELPQRQREAFLECFRGETLPEVLAERWQVNVRTIQSDIRSAILHCATRLGRKNILAGKRVKLSRK